MQEPRHLGEVTPSELADATLRFVEDLNLAGGSLGDYDLYTAINNEYAKAVLELKKYKEDEEKYGTL